MGRLPVSAIGVAGDASRTLSWYWALHHRSRAPCLSGCSSFRMGRVFVCGSPHRPPILTDNGLAARQTCHTSNWSRATASCILVLFPTFLWDTGGTLTP